MLRREKPAPSTSALRCSAARKSADDHHLVVLRQCTCEVARSKPVHEEPNVRPDRALFIDDSKAEPRILAIEIANELIECSPMRAHCRRVRRIGPQRSRDQHAQRRLRSLVVLSSLDGVDVREMRGNAFPASSFVATAPYFSASRAEVNTRGVRGVR